MTTNLQITYEPIFRTSSDQLCPGSTKLWRQPSNQLRGARGASGHACSTGLSTGRRLMPMTARCGAAAPCRGATTVRVAAHETSENEGDGCVDRTERVQLQPHAKLMAIQTEACPPVRSTQPANALHALLYKIHTVSRWKRRCNCLDCHEFSSTPLRFRPHPRMPMQLSFRLHPRMQRCSSARRGSTAPGRHGHQTTPR